MRIIEKSIRIAAPVERAFDLFSDFRKIPGWMRNIRDVRYTGRRTAFWSADTPPGARVEWETETTHFEPDHRIIWRTLDGDLYMEGETIFEEIPDGSTLMRIVFGFEPTNERLHTLVTRLFGRNLDQQIEEDLERFAAAVEVGHRRKRDRYEDERRRADARRRPFRREAEDEARFAGRRRDVRGERRVEYFRDERGELIDYPPEQRHRSLREMDERPGGYEERERRARFNEELRAARRSQLEGMRYYHEERLRRERHERSAQEEDDPRRARERDFREHRERNEREEYRPRYALTPRERARERMKRLPDYEAPRLSFRRGVDKLLDDPPSRHWRED